MTETPFETPTSTWQEPPAAAPLFEASGLPTPIARRGRRVEDGMLVSELQRCQEDIERAAAALHRAQPDLMVCDIASDDVPQVPGPIERRSTWPFVVAILTSTFLWLSVGWAITTLM